MTRPPPLLLASLSSILLVVLVLPSTVIFKTTPQLVQFFTVQQPPPERTPPNPVPAGARPPPKKTAGNTTIQQPPAERTPPNPVPGARPPPPKKMAGNPSSDARQGSEKPGPYHDWEHFNADYNEMMRNLKIYVYPDVHQNSSPFSNIFLPRTNLKKLGNYYSEHAFKTALLSSTLLTSRPEEAHFFYMPFSINLMRYDGRLHSVESINEFVGRYTDRISSEFAFWNASGGTDHLYVYCHSVGRDAASSHGGLLNNAIQVTCSSSYSQKLYVSHKDVALPQVWPRPDPDDRVLNTPDARDILVFFAGRKQNARVREKLIALWGNETSMAIYSNNRSLPYEEGFRRSRYCLSVKGYEVNTARVSDAIHFGCIPVIISDYYDLPLNNVLDWSKFSVIINEQDVEFLKEILLSISEETYLAMYNNLYLVRRHFAWHTPPENFDSFYMTAYQLWLRRGLHRLSY
ncbi:probable glycosyltransferase At5g03795 [Rhododendron vialii]|uniref:probable glycosyltransferase At5g03795 n=1 Tax=Rhododendron vialii TaxID=182163 RepID=UPI00265F0A90|nr:probable glycosyltransferase At5g03795 [Rhododendron vialii]